MDSQDVSQDGNAPSVVQAGKQVIVVALPITIAEAILPCLERLSKAAGVGSVFPHCIFRLCGQTKYLALLAKIRKD